MPADESTPTPKSDTPALKFSERRSGTDGPLCHVTDAEENMPHCQETRTARSGSTWIMAVLARPVTRLPALFNVTPHLLRPHLFASRIADAP
nr:hypothetical protein CFP56_26093 [Quercus suber]